MRINFVSRIHFFNFTFIHNHNPVTYIMNNPKVVRNKNAGETKFFPEVV